MICAATSRLTVGMRRGSQIPQMYALLKEFRYVVVLDPDAYFAKPAIPLHLLLGHWGWKPHSRCVCRTICSKVCARDKNTSGQYHAWNSAPQGSVRCFAWFRSHAEVLAAMGCA